MRRNPTPNTYHQTPTLNFPTFSQWKQVFKILSKKEKKVFLAFFLLALASFVFLVINFYLKGTESLPAFGESYTEGIVGQPRLINPIYSQTNDIDRTLTYLVFSGLMTHDKNGKIVKDLAENYSISEDGKIYDFELKKNIFWHDGKELTADDIIFTIETIQNSDYKSPSRANWIDVEAQKVSSRSVRFVLEAPYGSFLESLTAQIIPKHIWEDISPENFALSPYNLQPVGSGPYKFSGIKQVSGFIKSISLESNRRYYNQPPYIKTLSFQFFENKDDLSRAINLRQVDGFSLTYLESNGSLNKKKVNQEWVLNGNFSVYSFSMPRYFAVFFNTQKSSIFADSNLRKSMIYSANKDEIVEIINSKTENNVVRVDSPILPDFFGYRQTSNVYNFDVEKANTLLDKTGFFKNNSGIREKALKKELSSQFNSYLKVGSKGAEVTRLQSCLSQLDENFKNLLKDEASGSYTKITGFVVTEFQKKYLPDLKPTGETGTSTRKTLNELCTAPLPNSQPLKFTLTTANQPQLLQIADLLKNYWQNVGVTVQINALSVTELKPVIKTRSYEALLYGQALGSEPDLYPFWHSSQRVDPGLNLSSYENKEVDKLLKEARETMDDSVRQSKYENLQDIITNDASALFLYNPDYVYWVSKKIRGITKDPTSSQDTVKAGKIIDPANRFSNITNWYIKTKRIWK